MNIQIWQLVVTFISGSVVAALISGIFNIFNKRREYIDDYFKIVVEKRVNAYMDLQRLVMALKTASIDPVDEKTYHIVLQNDESVRVVREMLFTLSQHDLWFSNEISNSMIDLSRILFSFPPDSRTIASAKENYKVIATTREKIEKACVRDIANLHKVPKFLKSKTVGSGFVDVLLRAWIKQS